VDKLRDQLLEF